MKRVLSLAVCAGLGFGLSAAAALAAPPIVDRLPDDAVLSVVIPAPERLQKNLADLATAVNAPMQPPSVQDVLGMMGITGGVDTTRPLAFVAFGPADLDKPGVDVKTLDWQGSEDRAIVLVPVSDHRQFVANLVPDAKPEDKVVTFLSPDGSDVFIRDAGEGYAVLGPDRALVEAYTGKAGPSPIKARMGRGGEALADSADIVTIINMDRLRPAAEQGIKEARAEAERRAANMPGGGAGLEKNLDLADWFGEQVVRDTQVLVGGMKFGTSGVVMDMVGSFKPDSYLAKAAAGSPSVAPLMSRLPAGPYLWAGAIDVSAPGLKTVWRDMMSRAVVPGGDKAKAANLASIDAVDGMSAVVGVPLGGIMAGILTSTVSFTASKNPDAAVAAFKQQVVTADGGEVAEGTGVKVASKYVENGATAGTTQVDVWEMKVQPAAPGEENEGAMQQQQLMAFLFGAQAAPAGYVAKTDGGFYTTYVKSAELVTKALGAGKGENLGSDAMIQQTREMLPQSRVAEAYVGTKSILDLGLPLMAMGGVQVPADELPQSLAPIGAAISNQNGALRMTIAVPSGVIKTGMSLGMALQAAQQQGENGEDMAPGEDGTGQPKF